MYEAAFLKTAESENTSYKAFRTLYILLGGSGMKAGLQLRRRVLETYGIPRLPFQSYLWLDTDQNDLSHQTGTENHSLDERLAFGPQETLSLQLSLHQIQNIQAKPHETPWLSEWLSSEMLAELSHAARTEMGTEQNRALGRLAFEVNFQAFKAELQEHADRLLLPEVLEESRDFGYTLDDSHLEVVIISSLAGGTGSGAVLKIGQVVQALVQDSKLTISAYLLMPSLFRGLLSGEKAWEDAQANAYAALMEFNALAMRASPPLWIDDFKVEGPSGDPFNQVYLLDSENIRGCNLRQSRHDDASAMIAESLFLDFEQSPFGTLKRSHRHNVASHLLNTAYLEMPVEDGTRQPEIEAARPRYIFRFPTAFASFGLSRMPFEQPRLIRVAGAWLAEQMMSALLEVSGETLSQHELREQVVHPRIERAALSGERIIDRLLMQGPEGEMLPAQRLLDLQSALSSMAEDLQSWFGEESLPEKERLERLRGADRYGKELQNRVHNLIEDSQRSIQRDLSDTGARRIWGVDLSAIVRTQDTLLPRLRAEMRTLALDLLADPQSQGLKIAVETCSLLHEQFRTFALEMLPDAEPISLDPFGLDPSKEVNQALSRRKEAAALPLPLYRNIAINNVSVDSKLLLKEASKECIERGQVFLKEVEQEFERWCFVHYRAVAQAHCQGLFRELAEFVGSQVQAQHAGEEQVLRSTGLRLELRHLSEGIQHARQRFQNLYEGLYNSSNVQQGLEHLEPSQELSEGVVSSLAQGLDRPPWRELLMEEWGRFFMETRRLPAGSGDLFTRGLELLLETAVTRQVSRGGWQALEASLEDWSVSRLAQAGYLGAEDALSLLSTQSRSVAVESLDRLAKAGVPWLKFIPEQEEPPRMQSLALLAAPHSDSVILADWAQQQKGALQRLRRVSNQGGSIALYTERMAFPLFAVKSLMEIETGYQAAVQRGGLEVAKRHTTQEHLDLPSIRPPQSPEEAALWFENDRLALEATLLNFFERTGGKRLECSTLEEKPRLGSSPSAPLLFPNSLKGIATKLRDNPQLVKDLRQAVEKRREKVFAKARTALHALSLTIWVQKEGFPRDLHFRDLEHELAASLTRLWRETAEQRLNLAWDAQPKALERISSVPDFADPSPVRTQRGVPLYALPLRLLEEAPPSGSPLSGGILSKNRAKRSS